MKEYTTEEIFNELWKRIEFDANVSEELATESNELQARIDKALFNIQRIIDYGFDYDGFNSVESLKGLIDMLVGYAEKAKDILTGGDKSESK